MLVRVTFEMTLASTDQCYMIRVSSMQRNLLEELVSNYSFTDTICVTYFYRLLRTTVGVRMECTLLSILHNPFKNVGEGTQTASQRLFIAS